MEQNEPVFDAAAARAYILAKFREQGDFLQLHIAATPVL